MSLNSLANSSGLRADYTDSIHTYLWSIKSIGDSSTHVFYCTEHHEAALPGRHPPYSMVDPTIRIPEGVVTRLLHNA